MTHITNPVMTDLERRFQVYAGANNDPDTYFIWFESEHRFVRRKTGETGQALWARVLTEIDGLRAVAIRELRYGSAHWWQRDLKRALAHVFAGIEPTEDDLTILFWHYRANCLMRQLADESVDMRNKPGNRVQALREMRVLLQFQGMPGLEEVRKRAGWILATTTRSERKVAA